MKMAMIAASESTGLGMLEQLGIGIVVFVAGQFLGIGVLVVASAVAALLALVVPEGWVALLFRRIGRSPLDSSGHPFPLLHLELPRE